MGAILYKTFYPLLRYLSLIFCGLGQGGLSVNPFHIGVKICLDSIWPGAPKCKKSGCGQTLTIQCTLIEIGVMYVSTTYLRTYMFRSLCLLTTITQARTHSTYKWTKISSLQIDIFDLKMMMKSGLEFFIFKISKSLKMLLLSAKQMCHERQVSVKVFAEF